MIDENSTFGGFLTNIGEAKQTNANALEIPWRLTHMLLGDANGTDPVPAPEQTQLINQVYRAAINQLFVDPANPAILIAELVLPPNVGGWWIRELGLEDEDGDFVAVANCAPSYKPLLAQGSGRNQVVRMHLIVSNTANVQLKIDPSVVLATRKYVDDQRRAHEKSQTAHEASQVGLDEEIPQAPGAENVAGALAALGAFAADGFQNIAVFDTAGVTEWDVPEVLRQGLRKAHVTVIGGGGAGGRAERTTAGPGGGGAGGFAEGFVDLEGVETVSITIGAGAQGRSTDGTGANGTSSSFGVFGSATGGDGGAESGGGGSSGIGSGLDYRGGLGDGHYGALTINGASAGGSGGGPGGGRGVAIDASNGALAGAGGGGSGRGVSGNGADGKVIVRW